DLEIEQADKGQAGTQLDEEIAHRERRATSSAAAAQHPVADERDVVVPAHFLKALAAVRAGPEDALLVGQPHDADIKPTAHGGPEDKHEAEPDEQGRFHEE